MPVLFGRTFWSCQHISPPVWRITAGIFWIAIAQFRLNTLHGMLWLIASIVTIGFRPLPAFAAIAKLPQEDTTTSAFQVPSREEATSSASDTCSSGSDVRSLSHQGKWGVFNRGDGSAAGFGPVKNYGTEPWAEEWRELPSGPCSPHDPLDALKHIDLNDSRSIWLSLSGETRLRNWFDSRPDLGAYHNNDSGRFTVRNLYGADLHLGTHVRVFGQLVNGEAAGWNAFGYGPTYRKAIDLQQAFIEITGKAFGARQGFIFGRQEFLDGVNITVAPPNLHVFGGIGWSFLDLFYIGYKLAGHPAAASTVQGALAGSTTRNNLGFRWHGSAGPLVFSMGGIYQGGIFHEADSSMRRPVAAFSINTSLAYRFRSVPWVPLLGIQTDIYSGGGANSRTGPLGNYIEPFGPNTNYIDTTTYLTGSNLVGVTPFLSLNPLSFLNISLKYPFYWRESTDDAVYSYFLAGRYTFTRPMSGGFIGMAPQASKDLKIGRYLTWTQYVARFITSHSLDRVGGSSSTYYQSNLVFRF